MAPVREKGGSRHLKGWPSHPEQEEQEKNKKRGNGRPPPGSRRAGAFVLAQEIKRALQESGVQTGPAEFKRLDERLRDKLPQHLKGSLTAEEIKDMRKRIGAEIARLDRERNFILAAKEADTKQVAP